MSSEKSAAAPFADGDGRAARLCVPEDGDTIAIAHGLRGVVTHGDAAA